MKALALTDHDDMGVWSALGTMRGDRRFSCDSRPGADARRGLVASDQAPEVHHLTLLARDKEATRTCVGW
ncbi:MAG: hypothetical protein R3F43_30870 [bacterium]